MEEMKKKIYTAFGMFILEIIAIGTFVYFCCVLGEQKALFSDVDKFKSVILNCIESDKYVVGTIKRGRRTVYRNTYEYVVDGETYAVEFHAENAPGKQKVMYCNPNDPKILSKFKNYSEAISGCYIWIILSALSQGIVVVYILRYVNKQKDKKNIEKARRMAEQKAEDEFDFLNNIKP